jgi:hypothetical protein
VDGFWVAELQVRQVKIGSKSCFDFHHHFYLKIGVKSSKEFFVYCVAPEIYNVVVLRLNFIFISGGKIVGEIRVLLAAGLGTQVYRLNLLIDEDESSYSSKNVLGKLQIPKVRTIKFMLSNTNYEMFIISIDQFAC